MASDTIAEPFPSTTNLENDAVLTAAPKTTTPVPATLATTAPVPPPLTTTTSSSNSDNEWQECLDRAINAIVNTRVLQVRAMANYGCSSTIASGFVVNKKHNIILTNRHVVGGHAPVVVDALLHNKEEIDLKVIYADPVHDFAFVSYNPDQIKYQKMQEIELDPEGARVGVNVRVIGNDAGEKIQVLPGILARLDRDSPYYGAGYNDFNTFYISAASSTSGGSSGSPVLAQDGKCVALNCGAAKQAASSFYLPLHRVKRALDLIIAAKEKAAAESAGGGGDGGSATETHTPILTSSTLVPRGTIQTIFRHKAYDELRRLGLTTAVEGQVRAAFPEETGLLVVEQCLKGGPGEGVLEPGDVLLEVAGEMISTFLPLESYLDDHVGSTVTLRLQRGGEEKVVELLIKDLHALTPKVMYTISGAVLHPVTVHLSKTYHLEAGTGVHLASTGYMFSRAGITIHCIILSVNGVPTPTIAALEEVFEKLPDGLRTSVTYHSLTDRFRVRTAIITVDKKWFSCGRLCYAREAGSNALCWTFEPSAASSSPSSSGALKNKEEENGVSVAAAAGEAVAEAEAAVVPMEVEKEKEKEKENGTTPAATTTTTTTAPDAPSPVSSPSSSKLKDCLVMCSYDVPYLVDGMSGAAYVGAGIIVDKTRGFVLVDRCTAPCTIGDGYITFGGILELPAKCVFVHPLHNFSVLQYNPSLLEAEKSLINVAEADFGEDDDEDMKLAVGETLLFHGLTTPFNPVTQKSTITRTDTLKLIDGRPPTFVSANTSVFHLDHVPGTNGLFEKAPSSTTTNTHTHTHTHKVVALRLCYSYSHDGEVKQVFRTVPSEIVRDTIKALKHTHTHTPTPTSPPTTLHLLPLKFTQMPLAKVKAGMGLKEEQFQLLSKKIQATNSEAALLVVRRVPVEMGDVLKTGDVVLSVNGEPLVRPYELEKAVREAVEGQSQQGGGGGGGGETDTYTPSLELVVLRDHQEVAVQVKTMPLSTLGTERVVLWCGLMLQEAHLPVSFLGYKPKDGGIYCSRWSYGSPAHKYLLRASWFIQSINGTPTPDLDTFVAAVTNTLHDSSIRVKGVDLDGKPKSYTLKPCYDYWPTVQLIYEHARHTWELHNLPAPPKAPLHAA